MILRLDILVKCRLVSDKQRTDGRTHDDSIHVYRASIASRRKNGALFVILLLETFVAAIPREMIIYYRATLCSGSCALSILEISDNISETAQDRDMVAIED